MSFLHRSRRKNWSVSAKEGQTKQVTLSIGQGKETVSSGKIRAVAEEGASLTVFEVFEPAQAAGQLAVRTELYAKKDSRHPARAGDDAR